MTFEFIKSLISTLGYDCRSRFAQIRTLPTGSAMIEGQHNQKTKNQTVAKILTEHILPVENFRASPKTVPARLSHERANMGQSSQPACSRLSAAAAARDTPRRKA
jgi:hypothetical protein